MDLGEQGGHQSRLLWLLWNNRDLERMLASALHLSHLNVSSQVARWPQGVEQRSFYPLAKWLQRHWPYPHGPRLITDMSMWQPNKWTRTRCKGGVPLSTKDTDLFLFWTTTSCSHPPQPMNSAEWSHPEQGGWESEFYDGAPVSSYIDIFGEMNMGNVYIYRCIMGRHWGYSDHSGTVVISMEMQRQTILGYILAGKWWTNTLSGVKEGFKDDLILDPTQSSHIWLLLFSV